MAFKLEHLFNAGLMFLFLVYAGGASGSVDYALFSSALAYYYLYMLLLNSTVLEPLQLVLARSAHERYFTSTLLVAQVSLLATWGVTVFVALGIVLLFQPSAGGAWHAVLVVLCAGFFSAQTQLVRRLLLATRRTATILRVAAWNLTTLLVALVLWRREGGGGWIDPAWAFLLWQCGTGVVCAGWLVLALRAPRRSLAVRSTRRFFARYAARNLALVPTSWLFGNFAFIAGPSLFPLEQVGYYRKAVNFTSPILQYFSISGVLFLSRCAAVPGIGNAIVEIRAAALKRLLLMVAYASITVGCLAVLLKFVDVWRYLPPRQYALPLFIGSLCYVYVESLNYLAGSAFRANALARPLVVMSTLPCALLCGYAVLLRPTSASMVVFAAVCMSALVLMTALWMARKAQK